MVEEFKKYICNNCKGKCEKGIVLINNNGMKEARCFDYEKKEELEGYKTQEIRLAKQLKPIMRFIV